MHSKIYPNWDFCLKTFWQPWFRICDITGSVWAYCFVIITFKKSFLMKRHTCTQLKRVTHSFIYTYSLIYIYICSLFGSWGHLPGPNPMTTIYNTSVINFYNATGSLVRFENEIFYSILKNALAYNNAGDVAVNSSRRIVSWFIISTPASTKFRPTWRASKDPTAVKSCSRCSLFSFLKRYHLG
jgi:hypothetical protein